MTEETKYHVPITKNQDVRPSAPRITGPTWNPADGAARQQQIEEARKQQLEESRRAVEEVLPHNVRIAALEGAVARLTADMQKVLHLLEANNGSKE